MERQKIHRIELEKLYNTRDLGGLITQNGSQILPYRLIRSGTLFQASQQDINELTKKHHLGTIIDFRTKTECSQKPDPQIPGVKRIENPILDEQTVGITFEKKKSSLDPLTSLMDHITSIQGDPKIYIDQLYTDLVLNTYAMRQYAAFFQILLDADEKAVLWHCSAGKDRVGIGTALLLWALGVNWETILDDYVTTNVFVEEEAEKAAREILVRWNDEKAAKAVKILLQVDAVYLEDAFSAIKREYGSVENYLSQALHMTEERCVLLRNKFTKGKE